MNADETSAFNAVNNDRNANGVGSLAQNETLVQKAQGWSEHLLANSGRQCALLHSSLADGAPAGWSKLGENVGCATVFGYPGNFVDILNTAFMNSPGHRANILDPTFNYGGVGVASASLGNGMYIVYETQEFATL